MPARDDVSAPARLRRLIARGDLCGSDGGLYNPGAVVTDEGIVLLARREIDYRFTQIVHAERIVLDPDTLAVRDHRTLRRRGYPDDARIEDFRLIVYRGELLAVHTLVRSGRIRPMLSRLTEHAIEPVDTLELPISMERVEKNWVLFEHQGALHCLYRLDPLTIFRRSDNGAWTFVKRVDNGCTDRFRGMLSNSANLIPFAGGYLGFWHSVVDQRYVHGALLLDGNLDLAAATGVLLDGKVVTAGYKPGVIYVSALVAHAGRVLAFCGEADEHVGVAAFEAGWLAEELRRNPVAPADPVTVRLGARSPGELFRAMECLRRIAEQHEAPRLWVHVDEPQLADIVRRFGVPGLTVRDLHDSGTYDIELPAASGARRS
jgi:predicted GH43/DUF377 family glycosyl hydrolase